MKRNKKEPEKEIIMKKIATLNPKEKASVSGGHRHVHWGNGRWHGGDTGTCPADGGRHRHEHEQVPEGTVGITKSYVDKDGNVLGGTSRPYTGEHKGWGHHHGHFGHHGLHHGLCNKRTILKQLIKNYSITHKKLSKLIDIARSHLTELEDFRASISQLIREQELDFETLPGDLDLDSDRE